MDKMARTKSLDSQIDQYVILEVLLDQNVERGKGAKCNYVTGNTATIIT